MIVILIKGIFYYENGRVEYKGEFKNGLFEGKGIDFIMPLY